MAPILLCKKTIQSEHLFQRTNKSTKKKQQTLQQMQIVNDNCITSFFKVDPLVLFGTPSFLKKVTAAFSLFCVKGFPADSRNSNGNKLCPSFSRHISLLIRSRICTYYALYGKETAGISVQFHTQVERWCFVNKQAKVWEIHGPDVSGWTWDQRHNREQHFCFLPAFTPVDRERRSTSHVHLWQT